MTTNQERTKPCDAPNCQRAAYRQDRPFTDRAVYRCRGGHIQVFG